VRWPLAEWSFYVSVVSWVGWGWGGGSRIWRHRKAVFPYSLRKVGWRPTCRPRDTSAICITFKLAVLKLRHASSCFFRCRTCSSDNGNSLNVFMWTDFENLSASLSKNILLSLWNPRIHHRVHKSPSLHPILSQPTAVHPIDPYLHVILPPTSSGLPTKTP
jgi:hypothetical protein